MAAVMLAATAAGDDPRAVVAAGSVLDGDGRRRMAPWLETCYHEAGHAVVALAFGATLERVWVSRRHLAGASAGQSVQARADVLFRVWFGAVAVAGELAAARAQELVRGERAAGVRLVGSDLAVARESLAGTYTTPQRVAAAVWSWLHLSAPWCAVERLARELRRGVEHDGRADLDGRAAAAAAFPCDSPVAVGWPLRQQLPPGRPGVGASAELIALAVEHGAGPLQGRVRAASR